MIQREPIYQGTFLWLKDRVPGLLKASRRPALWTEVPRESQPALFLVAGDMVPTNDPSGVPTMWRLQAEVVLYAHSTDPDLPPSALLNPLIDAVEQALRPEIPGTDQTLGGLVKRAWISGAIETSGDRLGDQGVAFIPLELLVIQEEP